MLQKIPIPIAKARAIIDADLRRHHTIEDIARQVSLGKTRLKQEFMRCYGRGLYAYLREARMHHALYLVTETDTPFKQVARDCGFRHYPNFITAFHRFHHCSPAHARRTA